MTLNVVIALILLYFTEFDSFCRPIIMTVIEDRARPPCSPVSLQQLRYLWRSLLVVDVEIFMKSSTWTTSAQLSIRPAAQVMYLIRMMGSIEPVESLESPGYRHAVSTDWKAAARRVYRFSQRRVTAASVWLVSALHGMPARTSDEKGVCPSVCVSNA